MTTARGSPQQDDLTRSRAPVLTAQLVTERLLLSALHDRDAAAAAADARMRAEFLAEVGLRFGASLDQELTYAAIAGIALPGVGGWCIVDIVEIGGSLRRLAVLHPEAHHGATARALAARWAPDAGEPIGVPVVSERSTAIFPDASGVLAAAAAHDPELARLLEEFGAGPVLVVPIRLHDQLLGAITFVSRSGAEEFTPDDIALADGLAARCAQALESARLYAAARTAWAEAHAAHAEADAARTRAESARLEAEGANASKGLFLSKMSHELRTPLNAIVGYAQLMQMGIHGPVTPEQTADLISIQRSQAHLLGLVDEVLDYAQLTQGKVRYTMDDFSLREVVSEVEAFVTPQMAEQKLDYATEACDPTLRVHADARKVRQIVLNLVSNAMKFTPAGGTITVSCRPFAERGANRSPVPMHAVRVADTGSGISRAQSEAIFEPFVQLKDHQPAPGRRTGVGLGLAISRDLARGMGGDLVLESSTARARRFVSPCEARGPSQGPARRPR
ncbi:MAG TPA: ATP-binding protein [Gemmatimonadaceae bacterium]|nr:ATP-binding protein [Gemmatimonadaceae bacterium]